MPGSPPSQALWIHPSFAFSFNHLVGACEQRRQDVQAERSRGPEVDHQFKPCRLYNRQLSGFGPFEMVPKKGYVSLRRQRQFAMIGPATNTRVEIGLNGHDLEGTARLEQQPPGGMCHFKVKLTDAAQVDDELIAWIRQAYDTAG